MFDAKVFQSKTLSEKVTTKEKILGFFLGPVAVMLMNSILTNYLNVYYTDVLALNNVWGGAFLGTFPIVAKILDVLTFILMGKVIDRTKTSQGKARPWLLLSAPLLSICMIMLFVVPTGNEDLTAIWIFFSYTVFYAVAFTMYSTAHSLMVPLATSDAKEREKLSTISNTPGMLAGSLSAVLFPMLILPRIGVARSGWLSVMVVTAIAAFPIILLEYFYTRERVTEKKWKEDEKEESGEKKPKAMSLRRQMKICLKSRMWVLLMIYVIVSQIINALFSASAIYYCNWVLGSYNDGITQAMFYTLGQFPMGVGLFLVGPASARFGKKKFISFGFLLAFAGVILCVAEPGNLPIVLIGQVVRSLGIIPGAYLFQGLFGDSLDDIEKKSGERCDGFASSIFNCIVTLSGGIALFIFNIGIAKLGYVAPIGSMNVLQPDQVKSFIIFCVMGIQLVAYPVMAVLFMLFPDYELEGEVRRASATLL